MLIGSPEQSNQVWPQNVSVHGEVRSSFMQSISDLRSKIVQPLVFGRSVMAYVFGLSAQTTPNRRNPAAIDEGIFTGSFSERTLSQQPTVMSVFEV